MGRLRAALVAASVVIGMPALPAGAAEIADLVAPDEAPPPAPALLHRLVANAGATVAGNPRGSVDVVEFFDYRCPYCRRMHATFARLLAQDGRVRLVLKEWPIFGGVSVHAARVAIAAGWQGRFAEMDEALWAIRPPMDEAAVRDAARAAGLDLGRLDRDLSARGAEIDALPARTADEARALHLSGTPGLVIGSFVVNGSLSLADLHGAIADAVAPGR